MRNNVAYFRKRFGVTQEILGKEIGKTGRSICKKENGEVPFTQLEMLRITNYFKKFDPKTDIQTVFYRDLLEK